jgi:t-SNARE complex subunit (syntaxin)
MDEGTQKTDEAKESRPGFFQKKIVYAIILIAVIVLAVVLVAKFVFNVDLLNPSSVDMLVRARRAR